MVPNSEREPSQSTEIQVDWLGNVKCILLVLWLNKRVHATLITSTSQIKDQPYAGIGSETGSSNSRVQEAVSE